MPEGHTEAAPHFVIDEASPDEAQVRYIERKIWEDPVVFQRALQYLGRTAAAGGLEVGELDTDLSTAEQGASYLLATFFFNRWDQTGFDDATEDALAADPKHRQLIREHTETQDIKLALSPMNHTTRENPNAARARDAVRRSRVGYYIARVYKYQREQQQAALPAAG